ncbi:related to endoglucanase c [Ramularia collo-cygni]|uniref:Related to endoglucanase c n=1 Tax=Ramularia collo-cygni TaxID=112498 RepID=A0A2D3V410_9PEZI|nr:related to endoglucanase c [Ramularia collo-cygni]CZT19417.1 related to endoglucanase c [Ramularia collo-cygni]
MLGYIYFASVLVAASATSLTDCCTGRSITLEARIPLNTTGQDVDQGVLPFSPTSVLGQNQTFAEVLKFPTIPPSLNDGTQYKAVEVTLNDNSIFAPSATNKQTGFRRTELLPQNNAIPVNASTSGVQMWHLSVRRDESRQLNYSHEYYLFWLESRDFSHNQFILGTGTLFGDGNNKTTAEEAEQLWLRSNDAEPQRTIWKTPFANGVWHNVALLLDFSQNVLQVYYSIDNEELVPQGGAVANDLTGNGQFHIGLLKKPTGVNLTDITKQGFQESGIDEGIIFGGAFEEAYNRGL